MFKQVKMIRWLAPIFLLILLSILLLAVNYTASASTPDPNTVATAVSATEQALSKRPHIAPTRTPTPAPTQKLLTPTKTPKG